MVGAHMDAICYKLRPTTRKNEYEKGGLLRIGVAPYSGGGRAQSWDADFSTWWNRDLGLGGRVFVRDKRVGVCERLIRSDGPGG